MVKLHGFKFMKAGNRPKHELSELTVLKNMVQYLRNKALFIIRSQPMFDSLKFGFGILEKFKLQCQKSTIFHHSHIFRL